MNAGRALGECLDGAVACRDHKELALCTLDIAAHMHHIERELGHVGVHELLDLPARGGLQFVLRYLRRVDLQDLVVVRLQQGNGFAGSHRPGVGQQAPAEQARRLLIGGFTVGQHKGMATAHAAQQQPVGAAAGCPGPAHQ
jgi:hypothetical protein